MGIIIENIFTSQVEVDISESGEYRIDSAIDLNGCLANPSEPTVIVNFFDMPQATIYDYDSIIYIGDITTLSVGDFNFYERANGDVNGGEYRVTWLPIFASW